jgi:hypothetical protein
MKDYTACGMWRDAAAAACSLPASPSSNIITRVRSWLLASIGSVAAAARAISFPDAVACIAQQSLDASDVLWIVFSSSSGGGGDGSSSSSVLLSALLHNHWKVVAALLSNSPSPAPPVARRISYRLFKVRFRKGFRVENTS